MFLTRLKSTSTGASSSTLPWTSLTSPLFLLSEVPCDLASKDEATLCGKTKNNKKQANEWMNEWFNECNLKYLYLIHKSFILYYFCLRMRSHGTRKVQQRAIGFETPVQYSPLVQDVKSTTRVVRVVKLCDWFKWWMWRSEGAKLSRLLPSNNVTSVCQKQIMSLLRDVVGGMGEGGGGTATRLRRRSPRHRCYRQRLH